MTRLIRPLLAATALMSAVSSACLADLIAKETVRVDGDHILASDLFELTDERASIKLDRAPLPGKRTLLTVYDIQRYAEMLDDTWTAPRHVKRVPVTRSSTPLSAAMIEDLMFEAVLAEGVDAESRITLYGAMKGLHLPLGYSLMDVIISDLTIDRVSGRLSATLLIPTGLEGVKEERISGKIEAMRMVPTLKSAIIPGEEITAEDIRWERMPANRIRPNVLQDERDLIGKTVRRSLRPGTIIRKSDVVKPVMVPKGSYVTMVYETAGITLTATGRATENGSRGEIIRLLNPMSGQSVEARILTAERVEILSAAALVAANTNP